MLIVCHGVMEARGEVGRLMADKGRNRGQEMAQNSNL